MSDDTPNPAELFAQAMRDIGFDVTVAQVSIMPNAPRFQKLLKVLSIIHEIMDDESDGPSIDPREMLPSLGIMRMLIGEIEEMMLTAIFPEPDGQREPYTVALARKKLADYIYSCGGHTMGDPAVYEPLIQALLDAANHKADRMTDAKLDDILSDDEPLTGSDQPHFGGDVPAIFAQFLSQPDILS